MRDIEEYLDNEFLFKEPEDKDYFWFPDNEAPGKRYITFLEDRDITIMIPRDDKEYKVTDFFELDKIYEHTIIDYYDDYMSCRASMILCIEGSHYKLYLLYDDGRYDRDPDYEDYYGLFPEQRSVDPILRTFTSSADDRDRKLNNLGI